MEKFNEICDKVYILKRVYITPESNNGQTEICGVFTSKEKAEEFFTNEFLHEDRRNDYFVSGKYTWDYTLTAYNLNPTNQFIGLLGHPINFK